MRPPTSAEGSAWATPWVAATAARTAGAEDARATTSDGAEAPPGKCAARSRCPTTDSGAVVYVASPARPVRTPDEAAAQTMSAAAVASHTARGLWAIHRATHAQSEREGLGAPYLGTQGQNSQRPNDTGNTGSRIVIAASAHRIPTAPTGPRLRLLFRCYRGGRRP